MPVDVAVLVGVSDGVGVEVGVGVFVLVAVDVGVDVGVFVGVSVGFGTIVQTPFSPAIGATAITGGTVAADGTFAITAAPAGAEALHSNVMLAATPAW